MAIVENGGFGARAAAPIARTVLDYYLLGKLPEGSKELGKAGAGGAEKEEEEESD
jgi:penicillin-binding protein 2